MGDCVNSNFVIFLGSNRSRPIKCQHRLLRI